jgi:hypothetical protein
MTAPKTEKRPDETREQGNGMHHDGAQRAVDPLLLAALASRSGPVDPVLLAAVTSRKRNARSAKSDGRRPTA